MFAIFDSWAAILAIWSAAFCCSAGDMALNFCCTDCNWFIAPAKFPLARSRVASATGPLSSDEGFSVLNICWFVEASANRWFCFTSSRPALVASCNTFWALSAAWVGSIVLCSRAWWASCLASSTSGAFCTALGNAATLARACSTTCRFFVCSYALRAAAWRAASRPNRSIGGR